MKLSDIITLADNGSLPILDMTAHEQQFFACMLTALKVKSKYFYIKDWDGVILFSYLDEDDGECVPMLQALVAHSDTILNCIFTMPSDCEMTKAFENATRYSLLSLYGELIHCWLFDFGKGDDSSGVNLCMNLIYDADRVPGLAEDLIKDCEDRGMFG